MKKILSIAAVTLISAFLCGTLAVSAAPSYENYGYNSWGESVPQPDGYYAEREITGTDMGCGTLDNPQDMFFGDSGSIFIADTGNNRILVLDSSWKLQNEISAVTNGDNSEGLNSPEGVFFDGTNIFVADTGNKRILKLDSSGRVLVEFKKPSSSSFDQTVDFKPSKVVADKTGTVYTLVSGLYRGAILFTPDGKFDGFFGSNSVSVTAEVVLNRFISKFMTRAQRAKQTRNIPIEFTNFDIDGEGFVYTCTSNKATSSETGQLKKLNSSAKNIFVNDKKIAWASGKFGDIETEWVKGESIATDFIDVSVDSDGFVAALDFTKGRIFQYDSSCELTFIFGGKSDGQLGTFISPAAVESADGSIFVLDSAKKSVTVFKPTEIGKTVRKAILLHNEGRYSEAAEYWNSVIANNSNFEIAYLGLGKAYYQMKDYKKSMHYFELANDNVGRSQAFEEYRSIWLNKNLPYIFALIAALVAAAVAWHIFRKKHPKAPDSGGKLKNISRLLVHPFKIAEEMKQNKAYSFAAAFGIVFLFFTANLAVYQFTGRNFNINKPDTINVFLISLSTLLPFILFVAANWSVTTLLEGKGSFGQVFCFTAYSLLPYTIGLWLSIPLSYMLSYNESALMNGVTVLSVLWSLLVLVSVLMAIHQYTLKKVIVSILLTVFGMLVMAFLILMLYSLVQQIYVFAYTVFSEIKFRL